MNGKLWKENGKENFLVGVWLEGREGREKN